MQTIDVAGEQLNPKLFIKVFRDVIKLSPARFLVLRLHPNRYKELYVLADVPESIQVGNVLGPLGRRIMKVNCVRPPLGVSDGITIIQDNDVDPTKLIFEIHGVPEMVISGLADDSAPQSPVDPD